MSMVGQDNFDGSKVIDIGGQGLDCNSGYSSIAECIEGQSVMFDCCGYVPPPPGSVDLSSSTCANTPDPDLCISYIGSFNSAKSLADLNVDCSAYGTVAECAAVGAPTDFKDYCCETGEFDLVFGNNGSEDYVVNGQNDPDISLCVNQAYTFYRSTLSHSPAW